MQLRPYQEQCVTAVTSAFDRGLQRVYYVLPTGMGKTFTFVALSKQLDAKVLVLAHRKELLQQAAAAFRAVDPAFLPQIEQGGLRAGRFARVVAASVPTLMSGKRLGWFQPDVVVCDEAHHICAKSWKKVTEDLGCFTAGGPKLVGCTATPSRTDAKSLETVFEECVYSYSIRDGVEDGWLCDIRGFRVRTDTDLTGIKSTAGDFNRKELEEAVDVDNRTLPVIRHWRELASDRPTIVFCAGVEHARHVAEAFQAQGIRAESIDGGMSGIVRDDIIRRFKSGKIQVVTNDSILTEGFDYPAVSCIVMLRPTQSWALYVQCVGRGTRLAPGKTDCIVIDAVDNSGKHNLATVPALLGLPNGLDLQGKSLKDAARKVEQLGEQIGAVLDQQNSLQFSDLDTILEQVNLLTGKLQPPEAAVAAGCELVWIQVPDGFYVSCGSGQRGKREARLQRIRLSADDRCPVCSETVNPGDPWEDPWAFSLVEGGQLVGHGHRAADMTAKEALFLADRALRKRWPKAARVASGDAAWRTGKASDKQINLLVKLGYHRDVAASLDKGKASQLIDQEMRSRAA